MIPMKTLGRLAPRVAAVALVAQLGVAGVALAAAPTSAQVTTIAVPTSPSTVAIAPNGRLAFTTDDTNALTAVDLVTHLATSARLGS